MVRESGLRAAQVQPFDQKCGDGVGEQDLGQPRRVFGVQTAMRSVSACARPGRWAGALRSGGSGGECASTARAGAAGSGCQTPTSRPFSRTRPRGCRPQRPPGSGGHGCPQRRSKRHVETQAHPFSTTGGSRVRRPPRIWRMTKLRSGRHALPSRRHSRRRRQLHLLTLSSLATGQTHLRTVNACSIL